MARNSTVVVRFTGDTAQLERAMGDVDTRLGRFNSKVSSVGDSLIRTGGKLSLGLTLPLAAAGKAAFDAAQDSEKVGAQTEAVLKSTGNAANVTAGHIGKLAEQLSLKAAADDEMIQSGANVLLTFTAIRNSADGTNKTFDRTLALALDMSTALGTDLQSSVLQLGKALQDPQRGLTALGRAGVSFSEDQKRVIRSLVETGDTAKAQQLILDEVARQFEGSAEAQATGADRARVALGNLAEKIGASLVPVVEQLAPIVGQLVDKFAALPGPVQTGVVAALGMGAALGPILTVGGGIAKLIAGAGGLIEGFGGLASRMGGVQAAGANLVSLALNPVTLGIAAAGTVLFALNKTKQDAKQRTEEFTRALEQEAAGHEGVVDKLILERLERSGVLAELQSAGVDIANVTGAIKGETAAREALGAQLAASKGLSFEAAKELRQLTAEHEAGRASTDRMRAATEQLDQKMRGVAGAYAAAREAADAYNQSIARTPGSGVLRGGQAPIGRHGGGAVWPGQPFLVGERGPEVIVPTTGGRVVPNHRLAAGGGGFVVNVTVNAPAVDARLVDTIGEQIVRTLRLRGVG